MEEKENKDFLIPQIKIKRKVSIFKRRKKTQIRPFVRETKLKRFRKIITKLFYLVCILFAVSLILYGVRIYIVPFFFEPKNDQIISPVKKTLQISDIESEIRGSGMNISDIKFSKDLALVTFVFNGETKVLIDPGSDVKSMLVLLKSIENQMIEGNIRAIYIDLRYNKPIVKF